MAKNLNYSFLKILSVLAIVGVLFAFNAPPDEYKLIKSIPTSAQDITTDHLKNIYLITNDNKVERYDSLGILNGVFGDKRFGAISGVDATSPFNILIFFKDFATLLTCDNRFNTKNLYKLTTLDINYVSAACLSHDNYIWFYDQQASRLKKIDSKYNILYNSADLSQLLGFSISPNFLIERDGFIFLNDPDLGILVFDMYGTYYNSFPIMGLDSFQVIKNNVIFLSEGKLKIFNYTDQSVREIPLPGVKEIRNVKLEKGRLYVLTESDLRIYSN